MNVDAEAGGTGESRVALYGLVSAEATDMIRAAPLSATVTARSIFSHRDGG